MRLSNATLYKSLNLLQLKDIYDLELAKFMHRAHQRTLPSNLNNMFTPINTVHRYPTSSVKSRVFFQHKTKALPYHNWISTTGISLWQSIDPSLKKLDFRNFSKLYRKNLIDRY